MRIRYYRPRMPFTPWVEYDMDTEEKWVYKEDVHEWVKYPSIDQATARRYIQIGQWVLIDPAHTFTEGL